MRLSEIVIKNKPGPSFAELKIRLDELRVLQGKLDKGIHTRTVIKHRIEELELLIKKQK